MWRHVTSWQHYNLHCLFLLLQYYYPLTSHPILYCCQGIVSIALLQWRILIIIFQFWFEQIWASSMNHRTNQKKWYRFLPGTIKCPKDTDFSLIASSHRLNFYHITTLLLQQYNSGISHTRSFSQKFCVWKCRKLN